jgi:chemotaxis-related protein WspD
MSPSSLVACWREIGVRGDASCPKLVAHVHCRNCPVYSAAARSLLDVELPPEQLAEATRHVAASKSIAELDTHSVVVFRLGAEWFGLPTGGFKEIASERVIHSLPHRANGMVLGVANIRGELVVCISLERLLGLDATQQPGAPEKNAAAPRRLLVLRHQEHSVACPVDEVRGVRRFHSRELQGAPATVAKATATYTKAVLTWQERAVGLLDLELLFYKANRSLG